MSKILVTGSANGLGRVVLAALYKAGHDVYHYDIEHGRNVLEPDLTGISELDVLINNAGVNYLNWIGRISEAKWDWVMDTNAKGAFMMTKACLPMLKESKGTILNIISNAAWDPMTCSLAYNASKGALAIMTEQMARELKRQWGIDVFGIAPNKLKGTPMSNNVDRMVCKVRDWTPEHAFRYQQQALLTGEEIPCEILAEFISYLLATKDNHRFLSGCIIPYGA